MSIQAVGWVLDHSPTKGAQRLCLLALANHANERGEAWPSISRIAAEANVTEQTAKRTLADLAESGHIARTVNAAPDSRMRGDRKTNLYVLLDGGAQKRPPWLDGGGNEAATGGETTLGRGASDSPPNHQKNHQSQPSQNLLPAVAGADASFEEFWLAYPKARRLAKPDARRAWRDAIKRAPAEAIIAAAARYEADPNRLDEFTPYPQKWLKQERWNAPPEPRRNDQQSARMARSDNNRSRLLNLLPDPAGSGREALP